MTEPVLRNPEIGRSARCGPEAASGSAQISTKSRIDLLMLSVALIWGLNFSIMKGAYTYFDPLAFTCLRFILAVSTLILVLRLRGLSLRIEIADLPSIVGLGVMANTLYQILFVSGLAQTKAGNAALLSAASPIFAYLFGVWLKTERYSNRVLSGILLSFGGVGIIVLFGAREVSLGANWKGDLMILASALCWGWYTGGAARLIIKYGTLRLTLWVMLTGTLLLIPPLAPSMLRQDWLSVPWIGWLAFLYSTFLSIVYCYLVWSYALHYAGVSRTAVFSNLTPIIALMGGWLILAETPAVAQFAGVALIFAGVFIVRSKKPVASLAKPDTLPAAPAQTRSG